MAETKSTEQRRLLKSRHSDYEISRQLHYFVVESYYCSTPMRDIQIVSTEKEKKQTNVVMIPNTIVVLMLSM